MPQVTKRRLIKYLPFLKTTLLVVCLIALFIYIVRLFLPIYNFSRQNHISPKFAFDFLVHGKLSVEQYQGRTNLIILGIGGGNHEGADLTDTIIFLSLDAKNHDAVILSIPRDLWIPSLKDKINSAYHYGEEKKQNGGIILVKSTIEEVINQPVHYAAVIDFSGFNKMIDVTRGIDVNVEKAFEDDLYPIAGKEDDFCEGDPTFACRYEKLRFDAGLQNMDGERALKYVRSRHAEGDEGNDFSRNKRQQQVIMALKDKILKTGMWKDKDIVQKLLKIFDETVVTDMDWSEKISFAKAFMDLTEKSIRGLVLDTGDKEKNQKGFLVNPPAWEYDGAWVLVPRSGDFKEIQEYILCNIKDTSCKMSP